METRHTRDLVNGIAAQNHRGVGGGNINQQHGVAIQQVESEQVSVVKEGRSRTCSATEF